MESKKKLQKYHMVPFIVLASLGPKVLILPRDVGRYAKNDSWISLILTGIFTIIAALILYWIMEKNPDLNLSQIFQKTFGKLLGKAYLIVFAIFNVLALGFHLRIFADTITLYLLNATPNIYVKGLLVLLCAYGLNKGIGPITTVLNILFPIVLMGMAILLLLPYNKIEATRILPILYGGMGPVLRGSMQATTAFSVFFFIGYITPYIKDLKGGMPWVVGTVGVYTLIYLGIVLMSIFIFGAGEMTRLLYPTITLSKAVQVRGQLFERAEGLLMTLWIVNTFTFTLIASFVAIENLKVVFATEKKKTLIFVQMLAIYSIAHIAENVAVQERFSYYLDVSGVGNVVIIPLLAGVILLKNRKKSKEAS